jgi:hypothetical protein
MLCARVVRGINSSANEMTPVWAICWIMSTDPSGRKKPIRTCSLCSSGRSACPVTSLEP